MKNRIRRLVALGCASVILAATVFGGIPIKSIVAAETENFPSGLTEITFQDLGMNDGEYGSAQVSYTYSGATLDNTVLSGKFTFKPTQNANQSWNNTILYWGNILIRTKDNEGLRVQFGSSAWTYLNDAALVNQQLNMKLSIQYVNHDGGTAKDDVKFGIWIDEKLYNNEYIYYDNVRDTVEANKKLTIAPAATSRIQLESVSSQIVPEVFPTGLTEITFQDLGMNDGEYGSAQVSYTYSGATLDNTVLSGKFTFKPTQNANQSWNNTILYWGNILIRTKDNEGLRVQFGSSAWTYLNDAALVNKQLNMKLSIQYVSHDGGTASDDVKLGIWIDEKLYNNEYIYYDNVRDTVEANKKLTIAPAGTSRIQLESVSSQIVPEVLPSGLTEISLGDLGITSGEYGSAQVSYNYSGATLENTVLSGKFTFKPTQNADQNWNNTILYWGNVLIRSKNNEGLRVQFGNSAWTYLNDTSLVNQQLNMKLSIQYVNHDGGTASDDVKLGIWIDEKLYNNEYIYYDNVRDTVEANKKLTIGPAGTSRIYLEADAEPIVPEVLPTGLTEITFQNLGIKSGEYGSAQVSYNYSGATLDNTVLRGKFTFKPTQIDEMSWNNTILFWGNILIRTNGNKGLRVQYGSSAWTYLNDTSLVNQQLNMKLSIQYVNHDGGTANDDVKLGIWIDEKLYNNEYIYYENVRDTVEANKKLTIGPAGTSRIYLEADAVPVIPESFPTGLTEITFEDLDIKDGEYGSVQVSYPYNGATMDNTVLSGKFTFKPTQIDETSWNNTILFWGNILIRTNGNKGLRVQFGSSQWTYLNNGDLVNQPLNMKLSIQYVNHDGGTANNDVKLGVWIDGQLCDNEYIYYDNVRNKVEANKKLTIGPAGTSRIILGEEVLPERIQEITFSDFEGFKDGTYTNNSMMYGRYQGSSLNGKVLKGTVTFDGKDGEDAVLVIGGKGDKSHGLVFKTMVDAASGKKYLSLCSAPEKNAIVTYDFFSEKAGTTLVGKAVDLWLSFQFVNQDAGTTNNDLKLGVWFNGKLYNNEYIYLNNYVDTKYSLGNYLYATGIGKGKITLQSVQRETMPEGLKEISFWDFCIDDRVFEKNASTTGQYYEDSLDGTLFSGKVMFSKPGEKGSALIAIGSRDKYWNGLTLKAEVSAEGEPHLRLYDAQKRTLFMERRFYPEVVGSTLVGVELELQMSFEFVNHDGGKTRNDLKLGMWFNGQLYKNEYLYICNYVDTDTTFGTFMTIYAPEGSSLKVQSVQTSNGPISYSAFGLTKNWQGILLSKPVKLTIEKGGSKVSNRVPYTGDHTTTWIWATLSLGSILTCIVLGKRKRRN